MEARHIEGQVSRRVMLRGSTIGAFALAIGGVALSSCSNSTQTGVTSPTGAPTAAAVKGTATYLSYPGWIGANTIADFQKKYPGADVKQSASGFESSSGVASTIAQNPKEYDLAYVANDMAEQLQAGNFLLHVDQTIVPSLSNVQLKIRELFPWGVPIDTAVSCIGYRKDLVDEPIKTWADFWRLAPKYSGKVTYLGNDRSAIGTALLYRGLNPNTTNIDDLNQAKQALLGIKPHIQAFKVSDLAKGLLDGSVAMTVGWQYEIAAAMAQNPNIEIVSPPEGVLAAVEGIVAVAATDVPDVALAFLDYVMQPAQYADFVNSTSAARTSTAADSMIDETFLTPAFDYPDNAVLQKFVGADGVKEYNRVWSELQIS